jgi:3'-phosphoadenosine 5'-phosphosulfate sulfotransferase (PAPS reductase)/FAD synthetase
MIKTDSDLVDKTIAAIRTVMSQFRAPAIMSSFGKDSMTLLALCREAGFKFPVVYHREPWFPRKSVFADRITAEWNLVVHDWPPSVMGIKSKPDRTEFVSRYQIARQGAMDIPRNIEPPDEDNFVCGLYDIIRRPLGSFVHPWDVLLIGHKSCDSDQYFGDIPLHIDLKLGKEGEPALFFPLREWTHNNVWDYLRDNDIPVQRDRYDVENRREWDDKTSNNDYWQACSLCIDPNSPAVVFCPKFQREINNVSATIPVLDSQFSYAGKEPSK